MREAGKKSPSGCLQVVRPPKTPAASTPKGWSRELGAELLFQDPLLAQTIQNAPRPLVRPRPEGFQLAWPWDPEAPFPLPPVFCFARVQALGDRPFQAQAAPLREHGPQIQVPILPQPGHNPVAALYNAESYYSDLMNPQP